MSAENLEERKLAAWQTLCEENGWRCRICGTIPEVGVHFDKNLCDDCRLTLGNEAASNPL